MFGIAVAALSSLSEDEKAYYQSAYCGLCRALKQDFGQVGQATLNYDLTFLEILYDSLYEPPSRTGETKCVTHPLKKMPYTSTEFSIYCAQLSVALAYHKCLDDVADDGSLAGKVGAKALHGAYKKVRSQLPGHCLIIEESMEAIREIEQDPCALPDSASIVFGEMLAFCFECVPGRFPDIWSGNLHDMGYWLGRFIYMMDAAVDLSEDARTGSYNPFVKLGLTVDDAPFMRDAMGVLIGKAADSFERLPIIENAHLLRGILYQGVWQKFNKEYESAKTGARSR